MERFFSGPSSPTIFIDKLDWLVLHIEQSMESSSISPTHHFILARDQLYFVFSILIVSYLTREKT